MIKEAFTPLGCPATRAARQTTVGLEGCAEEKILGLDVALNKRAKSIFSLLRDRTAKSRFVSAELAWRSYRKRACTSAADVYRGGTLEPVAFATCLVAHNRTHLTELSAFDRLLRQTG